MKNKKVTPTSLGLVNRRTLVTFLIATLMTSLVLLLALYVQMLKLEIANYVDVLLVGTLFSTGVSLPFCAALFAYRCFVMRDDVMAQVCGRTHLEYLPTDIFEIHDWFIQGKLDEYAEGWYCICRCTLYRAHGTVTPASEFGTEYVAYNTLQHSVRVMFCFPTNELKDRFLNESAEHKFWRGDGKGGLIDCDRPNLANLRLVASA